MTVLPPPHDPTPTTPGVPPGWYHDPASQQMRWWDGRAWTEQFAPVSPVVCMAPAVVYAPRPTNNSGATASMVLGIISVVGALIALSGPFGALILFTFPTALSGLILGFVALGRSAKLGGLGRPQAIAGVWLSASPLIVTVVAAVVAGAS